MIKQHAMVILLFAMACFIVRFKSCAQVIRLPAGLTLRCRRGRIILPLEHETNAKVGNLVIGGHRAGISIHLQVRLDNDVLMRPEVDTHVDLCGFCVGAVAGVVVVDIVACEETEFSKGRFTIVGGFDIPAHLSVSAQRCGRRAIKVPLREQRPEPPGSLADIGMHLEQGRADLFGEVALRDVLLVLGRRRYFHAGNPGVLHTGGGREVVRVGLGDFLSTLAFRTALFIISVSSSY